VPEFTVVDHMPRRLTVETWDYPKPGDPNPAARLGVASVAGGAPRWIDLDRYAPLQFLIVGVSWAPEGRQLVFQVQDREQTWLDVNVVSPDGATAPRTLLRETSKAWVNDTGAPTWLKDGSFLWLSERTGWKHLYHYKADGTLVRAVTSGDWDLRTLHGVDEAGGWVYFAGTERSYIAEDIYRVKLDGTGRQRLSTAAGWHGASFSPGFAHYLDTWSDLWTPPQVRVHRADGTEVRLVHESRIPELAQLMTSRPELTQVKTRDGFTMEAVLIRPSTIAPGKKYPVMQFTYAGPYAPRVANRWGGAGFMYYQLLAQHGIGVWICDNRSASGKGVQSVWPIYKQMGVVELQDIEDGLSALKKQPWVDGSRIGLDGWSYGGFMTTYALTHSKSFAMGIGGGNVTDWRLYDSVYTERYMQMPQRNPEGYAKTSVIAAAGDLHGELLLIHGVIDDNVHMQNTLQLSHALQKAGKRFRLMLYERSRHGVTDPELVRHMRRMMFDFTRETLLGTGATAVTTATAGSR
jgi:dipeptidyl-peptidase-4